MATVFNEGGLACHMMIPPVVLPLSETLQTATQYQLNSPCAKFQKRFHSCLAAYGLPNARNYCAFEYRDWIECNEGTKAVSSPPPLG